jgi:hypothetical protein
MDGKTAKMIGAAAATLAAGPALAQAPQEAPVPAASSYSELLQPIPNAVERLKLADAQDEARAKLIPVQYYGYQYQNDHHHHHHHSRRWYLSHGYVWYLGRWVSRDYYNSHHHHHHHHHSQNYGPGYPPPR